MELALFYKEISEEPNFEEAYLWYSIASAFLLDGAIFARDEAAGKVETKSMVELQERAGTIFEKLSSAQIKALEDAQIDPKKYKKMVSQAAQVDSLLGKKTTSKSEFGYKAEEILLAVVSNRLDWEIGPDEIEFINKTLQIDPRIKFLLVGRCEDKLVTKIGQMCGPRAECLGPIAEIKTFLSMIDFLINTIKEFN